MSRSSLTHLRIALALTLYIAMVCPMHASQADDIPDSAAGPAAIQIVEPVAVPRNAAIPVLRLQAVDEAGKALPDWSGDILIHGWVAAPVPDASGATRQLDPLREGFFREYSLNVTFEEGIAVVSPQITGGTPVRISERGLSVELNGRRLNVEEPRTLTAWLRVLPPLLAIVLAVWLREVNVSLLLATLSGALIYAGFFDVLAAINMLCDVLVKQIADTDHASIILFTSLLGATIGLMNDSGGTQSVVDRMARFAGTRQRGQILTWLMGLVIFFDDYANTMLIGGAMRPLSDRLKISREKLAFLIDSTAAPITGIALVSTWVGFEIDQIRTGLVNAGIAMNHAQTDAAAQSVFLASIPYRAYPILTILLVGTVAITGRDFGSMLKAERAAQNREPGDERGPSSATGSPWFAILPVLTLITTVVTCYLKDVDAYRMLLLAALAASCVALIVPVAGRAMSFDQAGRSLTQGIISMVPAVTVLVLAWAVSDVCRPDKLDTAGFVISMVGDAARPTLLPAIAFIVAGLISVSIGSSFTTMALLTPVFIPLAWSALHGNEAPEVTLASPLFLGTVGAILGGAIFGDHCSPISDTTVLSSAAAGCEHLRHVATQMPYAILAAVVSLMVIYLPLGLGLNCWITLPVAAVVIGLGIRLFGDRPDSPETR
ncbi:MAG: hypothetical protein KDA96_11045 [Planctomycetaceae bacterium]|nr:hypothetical protein [Planctomycetaceae bacterium]